MASAFRTSQRDRPEYRGTGDLPLFEVGQQHSNAQKRAHDRRRVLTWFVAYRRGTADDCSDGLGMDVLAVRPRATELVDERCLAKTKLPRRPTQHGGTAAVLEVTPAGERELRRLQVTGDGDAAA